MRSTKGNAPLNLALIGCGRISQTYLQAIASIPACRLKGVSDIRKEAAQTVADHNGCRAYTEYQRVLQGNHIDAVIICTPPNTHAEIAAFFLNNGIHVLCEKPLALTSKDAGLMVKKAEEKGCLLMMASKFRYVEDIIKSKGIVESGILGDVILFENVFCSKVDMENRWNAKKEIAGGGVLIDNGTHSVDIARYLIGPILKVQAEEGKRVQKLEVEDTARFYFRTQSDIMGVVDLSWSIHKEQESYIDLFGTEGVLSIGWKCSKYRQSEKMNWIKFGQGYDKLSAFRRQLKNFVASIQGEEKPLINATDGLDSVKVIEGAYKSVSMNKWIEIT
ncbi:MAG: Gfo/Idh/MocA family protein [Candidatus Hodarchaeota archaeon]